MVVSVTFEEVKRLRSETLTREGFICAFCNEKGTDHNMGIGPRKDGKSVRDVVPLHLKCNPGYYGYEEDED